MLQAAKLWIEGGHFVTIWKYNKWKKPTENDAIAGYTATGCVPLCRHIIKSLYTVYELAPQPHISSSPRCRGGHNNADVFMRSQLTEPRYGAMETSAV